MPEIPDGAKIPQDHQAPRPKVDDPTVPKAIAFELKGVAISLDTDTLDDFEIGDKIGRIIDAQNGGNPSDMLLAAPLLRQIVGPDSFRALMDAYRDPNTGRVSNEVGAEILAEVLGAVPNS